MEKYIIIGNKTTSFKELKGVITIDELLNSKDTLLNKDLIIGQYLSNSEMLLLKNFCHENKLDYIWGKNVYITAKKEVTHKHQYENSLITTPLQISEGQYYADVWINGENEFIQDHTTGYHVQGMLLIEVVRQMFIAVSELFYARDWRKSSYVVIHEINSKFLQFTFPLPFSIQQKNLKIDEKSKSILFEAEFSIVQNNIVTFTATAIYSVYENSLLSKTEKIKAQGAIDKIIGNGE